MFEMPFFNFFFGSRAFPLGTHPPTLEHDEEVREDARGVVATRRGDHAALQEGLWAPVLHQPFLWN